MMGAMATTRVANHQSSFTYLREDQDVQLKGCDGMAARRWAVDVERSGTSSRKIIKSTTLACSTELPVSDRFDGLA